MSMHTYVNVYFIQKKSMLQHLAQTKVELFLSKFYHVIAEISISGNSCAMLTFRCCGSWLFSGSYNFCSDTCTGSINPYSCCLSSYLRCSWSFCSFQLVLGCSQYSLLRNGGRLSGGRLSGGGWRCHGGGCKSGQNSGWGGYWCGGSW